MSMQAVRQCAKSRRSESGAAAVEFALVMIPVVMLLLGVVTGGLAYSHAVGLTNAVREGARFGATGDATAPAWAGDTIDRVRRTQFDDSATAASSQTSVCVQLVRAPATQVAGSCSVGSSNAPSLSMPAMTAYPRVPTGLAAGTCVVRVVAARKFNINIALAAFPGTTTRGSVARYERSGC